MRKQSFKHSCAAACLIYACRGWIRVTDTCISGVKERPARIAAALGSAWSASMSLSRAYTCSSPWTHNGCGCEKACMYLVSAVARDSAAESLSFERNTNLKPEHPQRGLWACVLKSDLEHTKPSPHAQGTVMQLQASCGKGVDSCVVDGKIYLLQSSGGIRVGL